MKEVVIASTLQEFNQKNHFFERWSWFKFNNLGLALDLALKFYTSVAEDLKLKVRKFLRLISTFVEVTGKKLVGGSFFDPLPILDRVKILKHSSLLKESKYPVILL